MVRSDTWNARATSLVRKSSVFNVEGTPSEPNNRANSASRSASDVAITVRPLSQPFGRYRNGPIVLSTTSYLVQESPGAGSRCAAACDAGGQPHAAQRRAGEQHARRLLGEAPL